MVHVPILGGDSRSPFPLQFSESKISGISLSATLIEQLSNDGNDTLVGHGSGCFWRGQSGVYLLTARHVLSGRSPFDDTVLSSKGYIPQRLAVHPAIELRPNYWTRQRIVIDLGDVDFGWLEDPDFHSLRTDIAALPLKTDGLPRVSCLNDSLDIFDPLFTHIGMDCAIVGYPTPNFGGLMTPIWRRGTFASEPSLDRKSVV